LKSSGALLALPASTVASGASPATMAASTQRRFTLVTDLAIAELPFVPGSPPTVPIRRHYATRRARSPIRI
jgi:hypothetical protein